MLRTLKSFAQERVDLRFRGTSSGDALICYIITSRINRWISRNHHPNSMEFEAILSHLRARAKNVTACDYRSKRIRKNLDILFGFGPAFNANINYARQLVYYSTGASATFQQDAARRELDYLRGRHSWASADEFRWPLSEDIQTQQVVKNIILVGNEWTRSTFPSGRKTLTVPGISLLAEDDAPHRSLRGTDLLWLGSKGILHKGLHIAATVAKIVGRKLHVVGLSRAAHPLAARILRESECVYEAYPMLDVNGRAFRDIARRAAVALGTSVSEGMSTSILTAASLGVHPVTTEACGIDLGFVVKGEERSRLPENLAAEVERLLLLPDKVATDAANDIREAVKQEHSLSAFEGRLSRALIAFLGQQVTP
jgi:hypothetical protein